MTQRKFPEEGKCRTCRCPCIGPSTDLYQDIFKGQTYEEILKNKLSVELPNITGASCAICMRCTKLLESVDAFVRQCQQTNDLLVSIPADPAALEQELKDEVERMSPVPEKDASQTTTCYLEMDCEADMDEEEEFNGFPNDDETSDVPPAPQKIHPELGATSSELVVKLEMEQPANAADSADEDGDYQQEDFVLFTSELSAPKGTRQRGRGPSWKDEHLKQLLEVAKKYRLTNGNLDNTAIFLALRNNPDLSRHSREAIKARLFAVKRMVKMPGMPKLKNRIYESDALELFGGEVEL